MGILLLNIVSFAMPGDAYINPLAWGSGRPVDLAAWGVNQLLFEGRMRGLLALLFGAGVLLGAARAERRLRWHYARMAVLALFGLGHGYLLWNGDILLHYAILGCLLPVAWDWSAGRLVRAAIVVLTLQTLLLSLQFGAAFVFRAAAEAPGASESLVAGYRAMIASFPQPGSATVAADLAAYRGEWPDILDYHWNVRGDAPLRLLQFAGGETLGYMLLGMGLARSGMLTGQVSGRALGRMMAWGYGIGLPALAGLTAWAAATRFDPIVLMGNFLAWSIPFRVATALAHLALVLWLARRFAASTIVQRIASVGRMAFTNYLATSLVMTTLFYGYGGALFGRIGRAELYFFVAAMWAAMLIASPWWLARYGTGPLERLWRALSGRIANATQ
ncbi:hypothetical protein COC42_11390 [Sphingomonas spermidinifaciens]|uniref:DUF418 domain-containing protein n=1 Tax=Sphingomonas spermidinifaciens TaxID=1141889 RepID=A0A2A4B2S3_9SPHN|nr:DUF418 domain-containing protein [Sphingomonas spermidinifaciens]PCD02079.1 hypothetical protein COC42_11390 [Sphingomonas spermidinifaciens]